MLSDENTLSGQPESRFNGYLYAKRLIIRKRISRPDGSTETEKHMVYCCHCRHKWGPYESNYTTTTAFRSHFRTEHPQLPSRKVDFKSRITQMAEAAMTGKRKRSSTTPFTLAKQQAGARQIGQMFDETEYRKLLAQMVVETNT